MGSNLSKIGRLFTPNLLMLWSVLLGIATGLFSVAFLHVTAKIISSLMIDSLKLLSVPIIFFSIVATISSMSSIEEMRSLGTKVLKYTLISTVLAATIALFFFVIIQPVQVVLVDHAVVNGEHTPNYLSTLLDMFPSNIVKAFAENNVMGVVLLAFFLGISSLSIPPEHKQTLNNLFNSFFSVLVKMTQLLIRVLPLGIWAFVTLFTLDMKEGNTAIFHNLLRYIIAVFASTIFQGVVVLPLLLKYKGISPLKVFKGMFSAVSLAFFSKSSSATLPVTMKCACENLKISTRVANFSLPLCTTINMNGCAAFIFTTVLFVSMSYGMVYTPFDMVMWVFIATLAAIGNAGVPMGCYFLSSAFLAAMNMPLEIMGIILPIYTLMDMVETGVNVWSDCCVTAIVDKELSEKTAEVKLADCC
ncbi:MAG: dicarboxylate/amino acid:cation symporter [Chlamydiales bacterium 38-26]|nr:dicarboxylate/amino acid:cation symporter [Chlamydiales bacterium]OJV07857.1 MAG: dicarboxylate/amino acid:cation symporter [Chlamydiales bacterium 38-26]